MSTRDLSFPNWLRLHAYMDATPEMHQTWLDLVGTYRDFWVANYLLDDSPMEHSLTCDDMAQLLSLVGQESDATLLLVWRTFLMGASPEVAVEMLRSSTAPVAEYSAAIAANPRLLRRHLRPLVAAGTLPEEALSFAHIGMHVLETGVPQWVTNSPMYVLGTYLVEHLGEDSGAWRLFFELWDGGDVSEAIATVQATL